MRDKIDTALTTLGVICIACALGVLVLKATTDEPVEVVEPVKELQLICSTPFNKKAVFEYEVLERTEDMTDDELDNIIDQDNWVFNLRDCR